MIGHLLGAAGAVENIVTVRAIEAQTAPPTANFTESDPECDLDYVPNEARALNIDVAVSNNFAFGGANASIVWAKPGARPAPPTPDYDRVVITGMSAFTSVGTDPEALWTAYKEGTPGFEGEAGRVDFEPSSYLKPKERKRVDRIGLFSVITGQLALTDAALELTDDNRERVGVIVGTGVGPMQSLEEFSLPIIEEGPSLANPAVFPNTVYNAAGGQTAIKLGALGVASTVTAQHAAGAQALTYAYDLTSTNKADAVLAVASDSLTDIVVDGYRDLGLLGGFAITEAGITLIVERAGAASAARRAGLRRARGLRRDERRRGRRALEPRGRGRRARDAHGARDGRRGGRGRRGGVVERGRPRAGRQARARGDRARLRRRRQRPLPQGQARRAARRRRVAQHRACAAGVAARRGCRPGVVNSSSLGGTHISLVLVPAE